MQGVTTQLILLVSIGHAATSGAIQQHTPSEELRESRPRVMRSSQIRSIVRHEEQYLGNPQRHSDRDRFAGDRLPRNPLLRTIQQSFWNAVEHNVCATQRLRISHLSSTLEFRSTPRLSFDSIIALVTNRLNDYVGCCFVLAVFYPSLAAPTTITCSRSHRPPRSRPTNSDNSLTQSRTEAAGSRTRDATSIHPRGSPHAQTLLS